MDSVPLNALKSMKEKKDKKYKVTHHRLAVSVVGSTAFGQRPQLSSTASVAVVE